MSSAIASSPWPAPRSAASGMGWRIGRPIELPGLDGPVHALRWVMSRNCSIAPRHLVSVYLSLCVVSLAIAIGFWWQGATYVLGFAGVELLLVGAAFLVYARHAADREVVTVVDRSVQVEQCIGPQVCRTDFRSEWLCVEPAQAQGSLIELAGQGQRVQVGRFLRPEHRPLLAQELRRAVRQAQSGLLAQEFEMEVQR